MHSGSAASNPTHWFLLPLVRLTGDGDRTRTLVGCASLSGYMMELTQSGLRPCSRLPSARTLLTCSYQVHRRASNRCSKPSILPFVPPPPASRLRDASMRNQCVFCLPWSELYF